MTDPSDDRDDLDALKAVLDECARRKLSVGAVSVGSIRLVLAAPTAPSKEEQPAAAKPTADQAALTKLRAASRRTFGRVLPDEELLALEGAL